MKISIIGYHDLADPLFTSDLKVVVLDIFCDWLAMRHAGKQSKTRLCDLREELSSLSFATLPTVMPMNHTAATAVRSLPTNLQNVSPVIETIDPSVATISSSIPSDTDDNPRPLVSSSSSSSSYNPPVPGTIGAELFDASQDFVNRSYATGFIQGILYGNLSPEIYGPQNIQDALYCFHGTAITNVL